MTDTPAKIDLPAWDARYAALKQAGLREPDYGGSLSRHLVCRQDLRLAHLEFDNSPAALRLWNFLLTEEDRLRQHRAQGRRLVGTMKDLGTVPVMAYSLPNLIAFYPDGAWWTPCLMEYSDHLLEDCGGRIAGTDYLFSHALADIPEDRPPLEALAQVALADPMTGSTQDRAAQIVSDLRRFQAEAVVVSRIPGASHCAREGEIIRDRVRDTLGLPTLEIEVPPLADALRPALRSRLQALVETAIARRQP
jgi:hypothetical protein